MFLAAEKADSLSKLQIKKKRAEFLSSFFQF